MIAPVDQSDFGIALPQYPRRGHAAKTAADDDNSRLALGVSSAPGGGEREATIARAIAVAA